MSPQKLINPALMLVTVLSTLLLIRESLGIDTASSGYVYGWSQCACNNRSFQTVALCKSCCTLAPAETVAAEPDFLENCYSFCDTIPGERQCQPSPCSWWNPFC